MKKMIFILLVFFSVSGYSQSLMTQSEAETVIKQLIQKKLEPQRLSAQSLNAPVDEDMMANRYILGVLLKTNRTEELTKSDIIDAVNSSFLNQFPSYTEEKRNQVLAEYLQYFSK